MTQKQKAEAYDKALDAIKNLREMNPSDEGIQNWVNENFPELKESEGEKIRKDLIKWFEEFPDMIWRGHCCRYSHYKKDIIAWLEKQGQGVLKPVLDVEIPFGANDSELQEVSYYIPEGFHAELEDDKVIIKKGEQTTALPKWKYKKDNTPLLRDSLILNKYGCVVKSPSGAIVSDVWVIDYDELAKLPKEEFERQGEQKPVNDTDEDSVEVVKDTSILDMVEPKFKIGNWYQCTKDFFGKGVTFDKDTAYYCAKEGCLKDEYGCHIAIVKDLYDNFKLWTISDAKKGDVLASKDGRHILIFRNLDTNISFSSYYNIAGRLEIGWSNDTFIPATKEQRDTLFAKMKESGYEWDEEDKKLKKIEQNPACSEVDKDIMYDTLSNRLKFRKGEWIIRSAEGFKHNTYLIKEVKDYYVCEDLKGRRCTFTFNDVHKNFKSWDISDAKDSDVLVASDGSIFIFAGVVDCACKYYVALATNEYVKINKEAKGGYWETSRAVHPATKEQRDTLMKAMTDAGYTFDFDKKELKKIEDEPNKCEGCNNAKGCVACVDGSEWAHIEEQNPAWSEEDERPF